MTRKRKKHVCFELTDDQGHTGMVLGDPDMSKETKDALKAVIAAAHRAVENGTLQRGKSSGLAFTYTPRGLSLVARAGNYEIEVEPSAEFPGLWDWRVSKQSERGNYQLIAANSDYSFVSAWAAEKAAERYVRSVT